MNEEFYTSTDDFVIDLGDLFLSLLKKWRSALALLLVGLILGGTIAARPQKDSAEDAVLSEESIVKVEQALRYRSVYTQLLDYQQESPAMRMDPDSVFVGKMIWSIQSEDNLNAVKAQYENLLDEALAEKLAKASGMDFDARYISKLVTPWSYAQDNNQNNYVADVLIIPNNCVTYQVVAPSEEGCYAMLEVMNEAARNLDEKISQSDSQYSAQMISQSVFQADPDLCLSYQEAQVKRLYTARDNMQKLEASFSSEEKAHLAQLLEEEPEPVQTGIDMGSLLKWMVIGGVLGCILWGGWFLLRYLTDGKVKVSDELQITNGLPLLGVLKTQEKKLSGPDKWIAKLEHMREKAPSDAAYLAELTVPLAQGPIALLSLDCAEAQSLLSQTDPALIPAVLPTAGKEALVQARSLGQAVLLIRPGHTTRKAVAELLALCRLQKIRILGYIAVP